MRTYFLFLLLVGVNVLFSHTGTASKMTLTAAIVGNECCGNCEGSQIQEQQQSPSSSSSQTLSDAVVDPNNMNSIDDSKLSQAESAAFAEGEDFKDGTNRKEDLEKDEMTGEVMGPEGEYESIPSTPVKAPSQTQLPSASKEEGALKATPLVSFLETNEGAPCCENKRCPFVEGVCCAGGTCCPKGTQCVDTPDGQPQQCSTPSNLPKCKCNCEEQEKKCADQFDSKCCIVGAKVPNSNKQEAKYEHIKPGPKDLRESFDKWMWKIWRREYELSRRQWNKKHSASDIETAIDKLKVPSPSPCECAPQPCQCGGAMYEAQYPIVPPQNQILQPQAPVPPREPIDYEHALTTTIHQDPRDSNCKCPESQNICACKMFF